MSQACTHHPEQPASHQCDGCESFLCSDCFEESHALLLCKHCGERAIPMAAGAAATVKERTRQVRAEAGSVGYGILQALLYPFRGTGLFMYLAGLVSLAFVGFLLAFPFGCLPYVIWLGWLTLLAGVQFKIVRTTAAGDNELPDWPEYFSFGERLGEFVTWLVISLLHYGPLMAYLYVFGGKGLMTKEPSLVFWLGAATCMWLGAAFAMMGYGSAAIHWKHQSMRIDLHLRGLFVAGADALKYANLTFMMFAAVLVLRFALGAAIPLLGAAVAGCLGLYWAFVEPHLAGLLFRRHGAALHRVYEG